MKNESGFTFIELMVVIAIVSILSVIALSAYNDYRTRAKVSEGLSFAAAAKTMVTESYYANAVLPVNNRQAGLPPADSYDYEHISRLEVGTLPPPDASSITITYRIPGLGIANKLQLIGSVENGEIEWRCRPADIDGVAESRLPASCRGN